MEAAALCPSLSHPQHLQEDRDGLHTTAELLQVRVQSLMHILSMQEEELARKVGPCPRPRFPQHLSVGGRGCCAARTCRDRSSQVLCLAQAGTRPNCRRRCLTSNKVCSGSHNKRAWCERGGGAPGKHKHKDLYRATYLCLAYSS